MRFAPKKFSRRGRGANAFELLAAHLKVTDDAAYYAERLERLGRAMFGELWETEKSPPPGQPQAASGIVRCAGPCGGRPPRRDVPTSAPQSTKPRSANGRANPGNSHL